ncbi:MAG: TGS domain-containing protein [Candidatus Diapherotrites archaeon]
MDKSKKEEYKKRAIKIFELLREHHQKFSEKKIKKAFEFALKVHENDLTSIETPFIEHPLSCAEKAAETGLSETSVIATLLHNTYDCSRHETIPSRPENIAIAAKFGKETIKMIDSLLLIWALENNHNENEGDIISKLIIASSNNPELVVLDLVFELDQLEKQACKCDFPALAKKVLSVYVPLAHRMGLYSIKAKMEDKAFEILEPQKYQEINEALKKHEKEMEKEMEIAKEIISKELKRKGIDAKIYFRTKNIYSIYQKMKRKSKPLDEIYDISGLRIITKGLKDCYEAVGIIHSLWPPLSGEYDDYISKPKTNLYQSIHTNVISPTGKPMEIQIRTKEMHDISEYGVASHWTYKGHERTGLDFKLLLMRQFLEWKEEMKLSNSPSFDIQISEKIFVLSPKGKIIELPNDSTPIDFAYSIHSELGQKCQKAKVNDVLVPLNHRLKNLDVVEIISDIKQKPKLGWLSFVKSNKARNKLNQFFNIVLKKKKPKQQKTCFLVKETDPRIKLAGCCNPLPGDKIISIRTTKRKYSVHKKDCPQLNSLKTPELTEVDWGQKALKNQLIEITVLGKKSNDLMINVLKKLNENNTPLLNAKAIDNENSLKLVFQIKAENLEQLEKVMEKTKEVPGVTRVIRN